MRLRLQHWQQTWELLIKIVAFLIQTAPPSPPMFTARLYTVEGTVINYKLNVFAVSLNTDSTTKVCIVINEGACYDFKSS